MDKSIPFITPGRHPTIPEIRDYYNRTEILNEILMAMQNWHVRYVPGCDRQSWIYTEDSVQLKLLLNSTLDRIKNTPEYTDYPYFRINYTRYSPAHSWDESALWGYDFVIEKDSPLWQECFEAMLPVMDILEHFGVYYWLKYSGHHSLHLVIPAEVFPESILGVRLYSCYEALHHRLMVFLNRHANQHYNEHNRHCPPGTNMPYSVNEDTGLVNLPLQRQDIASFRPWHASIHLVEPRDFWRKVPGNALGSGKALLDEVLKPFSQQKRYYAGVNKLLNVDNCISREKAENLLTNSLCLPREQATALISSIDIAERQRAAWSLMILSLPETVPELVTALADDNADVRWFAAEALAHIGPFQALDAMLSMPPDDMSGSSMVDFCTRHAESTIPALIEALTTLFKTPYVSLPFDRALVRIGEASISYMKVLQNHHKPAVRSIAADILRKLSGTPKVEEVLKHSESHSQKSYAASMFGWYDDPRVFTQVVELITDVNNDRLRRECIKSLLWNDHPDAEQLLQKALEDPSRKVRNWAILYLSLLADLKTLTTM